MRSALLLFLLFWPWLLVAAEGPRQLFDFGQHLYSQGEYFRAITEFERLRFHFPTSAEAQRAQAMTARAYLAGGQPEQAATYLESLLKVDRPLADYLILFGLAKLDSQANAPYGMRAQRVEEAVLAFEAVAPEEPKAVYVQDFAREWRDRDQEAPYSPALAGSLSALLPGSGSFYLGRWREGAYAFLLTGLFAVASRESYQDGQAGLGALLGGFGLAFYGGNIYVALNSAHRLNDQYQSDQLMRLRRKHAIFFIPPGAGAPSRF
ncbi:MAG: outer membrane protein assembly factor BamD [bacterium]|nr:outer membrane protein assembly factor BamD [bacterium]